MDRLLSASLTLSAIGLAALAALAHAWEPPDVRLGDLARWEGQNVCVHARLAQVRPTDSHTRFTLTDGDRSLAAWAPFLVGEAPGDDVRACGTLARSSNGFELRPQAPSDLHLLRAWDADVTPLSSVASRPWDFNGRNVIVVGRLERDGPSLFLADATAASRIRTFAPDGVAEGDLIRAGGILEYDAERSQFRFRIQSFTPIEGDA